MALKITPDREPMVEEIQLRCALVLVNGALRCFDEGVLSGARDGDVGAVLGIGFPAIRGGSATWRDPLERDLATGRSLEHRFGARFEPTPPLVEMAPKGRRFHG